MPLAKTLAELRKKAKLTQSELGEKLSISAQAISKWENGTSEPDIATLKKLADIYGVSISYIVDPENVKESGDDDVRLQDETAHGSAFDSLCDVYLTEIDPWKKITTISYMRNMLGIGLAEAKNAVENLPYCISGMVDAETGKQIVNYLSEVGAKVTLDPCKGLLDHRAIISLTTPEPPKETHDMRKRFIVANITAGIPAIAFLIITLLMGGGFGDVMLSIYFAVCTYSLIFLLWYPTLARKLLYPIRALSFEGFFGTIGCCILLLILIPWLILVGLISPVIYAFSIKTRIQRMLAEDDDDDIFTDEWYLSHGN